MTRLSTVSPTPLAESLLAGPYYEPPYPGAVQDELAWHLVKYLREDARLRSEVEVEIPASADWPRSGTGPAFFTLDLVVEVPCAAGGSGGACDPVRRVAFEAAGGGRAGTGSLRDHDRRLRRDATLLAHGAVDTIYRLRGSDLIGHMDDVLYLASQWERAGDGAADVFSERGHVNLQTLASPEARQVAVRPEQPSVLVPYALSEADLLAGASSAERHLWHVANGQAPHVLVRRLDRRIESVWAPYADQPLRRVETARPALRRAG